MSTMQNSLAQIESMLATLVGGRVTKRKMGPAEFVHYAHGQIAKAMSEPAETSTRRLKALHASVAVFKDNFMSDEAIDVPIYVNDTTAMDDKSTKLIAVTDAADTNPDGQSAFEQGFVAKFEALRAEFEALLKATEGQDGEEDDDESADSEKRAAAAAKPPPFPPKKPAAVAADDEQPGEAKKPFPPFPPKKPATKGADVSVDGTAWPTDLNDSAFVNEGRVEKNLDWGIDPN